MLSSSPSPLTVPAHDAGGVSVPRGMRASSDQGRARGVGHDPCETGALGCG